MHLLIKEFFIYSMARHKPLDKYKYIVTLPNGNGDIYFCTAQEIADEFHMTTAWVHRCIERDQPLDEFGTTIDEALDCNTLLSQVLSH